MWTLETLVSEAQHRLGENREYNPQWYDSWDQWFQLNALGHRNFIGRLIVMSGEGSYIGQVGDHSLDMAGVFVISDNGYRGLLMQWLGAAKDVLAARQAVPA